MFRRPRHEYKPCSMLLRNLAWYSAGESFHGDVRVAGGWIAEVGTGLAARSGERVLELGDHVAFPGLINAHDHLDLDLLPPLGNPPYSSFYAWAQEIYRPRDPSVQELQRVALGDRLWWGAYKNLIAGVTTVMHHDPYHRSVFEEDFPLRVVYPYRWAHSLGYGEHPRRAYARGAGPFVIHAAEGTDARAASEIEQLGDMGLLQSDTILVHGVAISAVQWLRLAALGVALVWCPASNLRLYGRTVAIDQLPAGIAVALGTDSTLSGSPGLLDELKVARETGFADATRLLEMVTTAPAAMLGLDPGAGRIQVGGPADLLVLPIAPATSTADRLIDATSAELALVLVRGVVALANVEVAASLELGECNAVVAGQRRWLVGELGALRRRIVGRGPGDEVWSHNPLWERLRPVPA